MMSLHPPQLSACINGQVCSGYFPFHLSKEYKIHFVSNFGFSELFEQIATAHRIFHLLNGTRFTELV